MEQSTTTRDTPQWVQRWEVDCERGLRAYLLRVGLIYFGLTFFLMLAADDFARGTLSEAWFSHVLWSIGLGLVMGLVSWAWRSAWYDHYLDKRD